MSRPLPDEGRHSAHGVAISETALGLQTDDGLALQARLFQPEHTDIRLAMMMGGALGVPQRFYRDYAEALAARGCAVLTLDYRGIAESPLPETHADTPKMSDWGRYDIETGLAELRRRFPGLPLAYTGHSCGGQLLGLAPSSRHLARVLFVSCQVADWSRWRWPLKGGFLLLFYAVMPLLSIGHGAFPARRLGLSSVDVPKGVIRQWCAFARKKGYLFHPSFGLDLSAYRRITAPLLSLHISDDSFAPKGAVQGLLARYPATDSSMVTIPARSGSDGRLGHFDWFRRSNEHLWVDAYRHLLAANA